MKNNKTLLTSVAQAGAIAAIKYVKDHPEVLTALKDKGKVIQEGKEAVTDGLGAVAGDINLGLDNLTEHNPFKDQENKALTRGLVLGAAVSAVALILLMHGRRD